jgi:putative ABC transport system permease protein
MTVQETDLATGRPVLAAHQNYADWVRAQEVFTELAASSSGPMLTTAGDRPERLRTHRITANLFGVVGVSPAVGRGFSVGEVASDARVASISDGLWRSRFGADSGVVGRTLAFDASTYTVIGVMPRGFAWPIGSTLVSSVDLYVPYVPQARDLVQAGGRNYFVRVVGRLRPGTTLDHAQGQMTRIRDGLAAETPAWFADRGIVVRSLKESIVPPSIRSWMLMLLSAVALVLVIACANVANLLLARAQARRRELGVRAAMGATRWRLVRSVVLEGILLAVVGTAGGLVLAYWTVDLLRGTLPASLPRVWAIAVDLRVIGVASAVAIATGVLCALVPAVQMSRTDVAAALQGSGRTSTATRTRQRTRSMLLVAEVALAAMLLVGAGIFASSFIRLVWTDLGFDPDRLLSVQVQVPQPRDGNVQEAIRRTQSGLQASLDRLRALPGVGSAAVISGGVPLSGSYATQPVHVGDRSFPDDDEVVLKQVTADYLETIGARLLAGRTIAPTDTSGAPGVVVLNDEAVRRYFGGGPAIGARIRIDEEAPRTVIGVVAGMRLFGPERAVRPEAHIPLPQAGNISVSGSVVLRSSGPPAALVPAVKDAIWSVMPGTVIPEPSTFDEMFDALVAQRRMNVVLLGLFGALALLIASLGVYGVMAYLVEQRTREIGIRMALGAMPSRILSLVLTRAASTIAVGLTLGCLAAIWLERLVMTFVHDGIPHDPVVYGGTVAVLLTVGLLASLVPAYRAARVDPLVALRAE